MTALRNIDTQMPKSRRDIAKADKRRRIIEASRTLFTANGFDETTVQQIANAADIGAGTLFLYVADKSELLLLIFHEVIEEELVRATELLNKKGKLTSSVVAFFTQLISLYEKDLRLSRVYIREFLFHEGQLRAQLDEQNSRIIQCLQARILIAQERGEVSNDLEAPVIALHMYALYHSTLSFYLASCLPSQSPSEVLTILLESFWSGLKPTVQLGPKRKKVKTPRAPRGKTPEARSGT
jgi:AcrR family transcriptional regulator